MTEYLKNNPIALRHCLLYEYIQRDLHIRTFSNIRDTVGSDVFTEEEVRSIFNQFRKRKMEEENRPITDMTDILRNDKYALRACILYEFLKYKLAESGYPTCFLWPKSTFKLRKIQRNPSFVLHSNFCNTLGEDVMAYPEFDFWFRRFSNGEFDLNYERDTDIKMLIDMPIDIMKNIVEYLNIVDRVSLAKTSHSFKTFVEDQKLFYRNLKFVLNSHTGSISFKSQCATVTKCYIKKSRWGISYWKKALIELKSILKLPKLHFEEFRFNLIYYEEPSEGQDAIPEQSEDILETFDKVADALEVLIQQLHVKKLSFRAFSMKSLLKILPSLKPGYLTTIDIHLDSGNSDDAVMKELVEMEQWKQAKYLNMEFMVFVGPLLNLYHFKEFYVLVRELSVEDVREMKKILFNSSDFKKCAIRVDNPFDMDVIRNEFGDLVQGRTSTYHYPIQNSIEYFEIKLRPSIIRIKRRRN